MEVTLMVYIMSICLMHKLPRPAHGLYISGVHYQVSQPQLLHAHQHGIQHTQCTSIHAHALLIPRLESAHVISCYNLLDFHHTL